MKFDFFKFVCLFQIPSCLPNILFTSTMLSINNNYKFKQTNFNLIKAIHLEVLLTNLKYETDKISVIEVNNNAITFLLLLIGIFMLPPVSIISTDFAWISMSPPCCGQALLKVPFI